MLNPWARSTKQLIRERDKDYADPTLATAMDTNITATRYSLLGDARVKIRLVSRGAETSSMALRVFPFPVKRTGIYWPQSIQ